MSRRTVDVDEPRDGFFEVTSLAQQKLVSLHYDETGAGVGCTAGLYFTSEQARQIAAHLIMAADDVEAGK